MPTMSSKDAAVAFVTHVARHYFYGINVFCLEDVGPAGLPVRATVGAGMA
jgi:hypothetical protein